MPESVKPFLGIGLVIGFVIIIILCVIADSNSKKKFMKNINENYKAKDKCGRRLFITENDDVLLELGSGTLPGYKKWNIDDIAYVGMSTTNRKMVSFCFMDETKKAMKGEYLTPSKKPVTQRGMKAFSPEYYDQLEEIYQFIKKYKPDVQKCVNGEITD
jgi:hypothetical protein